ncbi:TPA: hypothetical protein ACKRGL_003369 [Proteus mirabilis]|nr:hypothetical protein [Proteus mirabilis]
MSGLLVTHFVLMAWAIGYTQHKVDEGDWSELFRVGVILGVAIWPVWLPFYCGYWLYKKWRGNGAKTR